MRELLPLCLLLAIALTRPGEATPLIRNASFEDDGPAVKGVGYVRDGNPLSGWTMAGDGEAARNVQGGPFADNGRVPDGGSVAVLQNRSLLWQEVGPFEPGQVYRLSLRANGRAADASYRHGAKLQVRLNGTVVLGPVAVTAVEGAGHHQVEYTVLEALVETGGGTCRLELAQVDPADGISVVVDDLRLTPLPGAPGPGVVRVNRARVRSATEPPPGVDFRRTQWIWSSEAGNPREAAAPGTRLFRRSFDLPDRAAVARAVILASADNQADVYVNGTWFGSADGFSAWYEMDITPALRSGRNTIGIEGCNAGDRDNPAGIAAMAVLRDAAGRVLQAIPTDASWRSSTAGAGWKAPEFEDSAWKPALALGAVGCQPWGNFGFLTWLVPDDFPQFAVPGQERYMELLRQLFWLHHSGSGPKAALWDGWLAMSSLWPATGEPHPRPLSETERGEGETAGPPAGMPAHPGTATAGRESHHLSAGDRTRSQERGPGGEASGSPFRAQWKGALGARRIDGEGYVSTQQHHGFGHGEGWPFPTCFQARGTGWQFANEHTAYRVPATRKVDDWQLSGLRTEALSGTEGWSLQVTADDAALVTPAFEVDSFVAPFIRLEWRPQFPTGATGTLQWARADAPDFSPERSVALPLVPDGPGGAFTDLALYRHPGWGGRLTRLRLTFRGAQGTSFRLLGLITATDNRHPVNNPCYLQGCTDYFNWTGDREFLRDNLGKMRAALAYAIREFSVAEYGYVSVPWVGHSGRAGWTVGADGAKSIRYGEGIGANYWDLLPFSGHDCLATIYLYDALRRMAALEAAIAGHPQWRLPAPEQWSAAKLRDLAEFVATQSRREFWNADTGRFVACRDTDGVTHDYGYTFVNCEAIYYGLAGAAQSRSIVDWLDGRRTVAGDTSSGEDIYHFRFGPRATTKRNVEWYSFVWTGPEGIPWGGQVQDGGAVLGFAFHDLMARLQTAGPDNAWRRLKQTLDWFADVRAEGGYRSYYARPGRGTLQGGGPPGGLGLDCEFFESVLVPQVMLYGFLGFRPEPEGFRLDPRLPRDWPELSITRIHFRDSILTVRATNQRLEVTGTQGRPETVKLALPAGWQVAGGKAAVVIGEGRTIVATRQ